MGVVSSQFRIYIANVLISENKFQYGCNFFLICHSANELLEYVLDHETTVCGECLLSTFYMNNWIRNAIVVPCDVLEC